LSYHSSPLILGFSLLLRPKLQFPNPQQDLQEIDKGLVHPKMKILSVFTHPHVVTNFYVFICSAEHKGRYLEECFNQTDLIPH